MSACNYWINKAKAISGMNEKELAKSIGTSQGTLCDVRKGRVRIPPHAQERIAIMTDTPFEYVLVSVASDQAKDTQEKAAWIRLLPDELVEDMAEDIMGNGVCIMRSQPKERVAAPKLLPLTIPTINSGTLILVSSLLSMLINGLTTWKAELSGQDGLSATTI